MAKADLVMVPIAAIEYRDKATMSRVELSKEAIENYTDMWIDAGTGYPFAGPSILLFYDGSTNYIARGWHRIMSAIEAGKTEIPCEVRNGSKEDAIWFSAGCDYKHGVRKSRVDKERSVRMAIEVRMRATAKVSYREIGKLCHCSRELVRKVHDNIVQESLKIKPADMPPEEEEQPEAPEPDPEAAPKKKRKPRKKGAVREAPEARQDCSNVDEQITTVISALVRHLDERQRRRPHRDYREACQDAVNKLTEEFRAWQGETG